MSGLLTKNPCVDDCSFDKRKVCKSCGRTKTEKKTWKSLSKQEKHAVWLRILETHADPGRKRGRDLLARYEKVRRKATGADRAAPPTAPGE